MTELQMNYKCQVADNGLSMPHMRYVVPGKVYKVLEVEWYPTYGPKICLNLVKHGAIL